MTELPQTDELPHADEGFDPARVEEAFATFAEPSTSRRSRRSTAGGSLTHSARVP